jgi:hypothetical protein
MQYQWSQKYAKSNFEGQKELRKDLGLSDFLL